METATDLGLQAACATTAGTHPRFVSGLVDMVLERAARERGEDASIPLRGQLPAFPDEAPPGSCRMRHGEVTGIPVRSEEHTSELQSRGQLVCRLLLEHKKQQP